jgi:hypothetical protein
MHKTLAFILISGIVILSPDGFAAPKIELTDDIWLQFSPRAQIWAQTFQDGQVDGSGTKYDFFIRRFRFLIAGGMLEDMVTFRVQLDASGVGEDRHAIMEGPEDQYKKAYLIECFLGFQAFQELQLRAGLNVHPDNRTLIDGTFDQMMHDRSGIQSIPLTAGMATRYAFNRAAFNSGGLVREGVRGDEVDVGITLWGSHDIGDLFHIKYFGGIHAGVESKRFLDDSDNLTGLLNKDNKLRYTVRTQVNFLDPENGYEGAATYLGKKKTIAVGASYDFQPKVYTNAIDNKSHDYNLYTIDLFIEFPDGFGSTTFSCAYVNVDLDGLARKFEGDGFYAEAGYYINYKIGVGNLQPAVRYVYWKAVDRTGGFQTIQSNLNYYLYGHSAKIQIGYEYFNPEMMKNVHSFNLGLQLKF